MTKTHATLAALSTLLAFSLPAVAQDTPPTPLTQTDQQFLIKASQGSVSDYANGAAAVNRAQSPAVRQLGIWIMDLMSLTAKQGADFDRAWLQQAIQTNKQDVSDAQKEEAATTDSEMRPLVKAYEATETSHLIAAQAIMGMMK